MTVGAEAGDSAPASGAVPGPEGEGAAPPAPTRADRWILVGFALYVALLLLAAYAQLADDRALLDLLDLKKFFLK